MKPAGMGRGDGVWHGQQSRGDSILWITDGIRGEGELPEVCTAVYCSNVGITDSLRDRSGVSYPENMSYGLRERGGGYGGEESQRLYV